MTSGLFHVPLWIELVAAATGGIQGALFAAGIRDRRIDVLGVVAIGLTVALGGSLMRDVVLDQLPVVVSSEWYLLVAAAASLLGMALQSVLTRTEWLISLLDAAVMGIFGAIGASKAVAYGAGSLGAVLVGVVAAVGGGVLRDLMANRPISIIHVGTLNAAAAGIGASMLVLLLRIDVPVGIAGPISAVATALLRIAAVHLGWMFPEQGPLSLGRAQLRRDRRATGEGGQLDDHPREFPRPPLRTRARRRLQLRQRGVFTWKRHYGTEPRRRRSLDSGS
ncbi:trimeric intracellular cation channel family protein [Demequina activiva]|uniref:Glycine transporter domain-containing protein n=1 Tax=Demequina activiva TaxID=1582364 RepID=A0A919UKD4_9MICO|nr:TRIC cation channel family protein [Demequina activiva]GIG53593.1 hypothetical protein Dac01nite_03450 [Demequina activiva]